jgi:hypothetical protein
MVCDDCGKTLSVGEWPWCPHGETRFHVDAFEPYFDEHLSPEGMWITSARQRRKYMDSEGIDFKRKYEKPPGQTLYFDIHRG